MKNGCIGRRFVGMFGMLTILLVLSGCGRERVNPIDPSFSGSETLTPPGNIKATGDIGRITLTWNPVTNTDLAGYGIWRSTSATGGYVRLKGESADTSVTTARTTFIDTTLNLTVSKIYFYRINTVDVAGRSSSLSAFTSGEAQVDNRAPNTPSDLSAVTDVSSGRVTLSWTTPQTDRDNQILTGLTQYKIYRSKDSQTAFVLVATIPAGTSTYVDKDALETNAQYFYRISAVDAVGNESARSTTAALTTAGTGIPAPTGLRATGQIGQIVIAWTAVTEPHLVGYLVVRSTSTQSAFVPVTSDTLFTTGQTEYIDKNVVANQIYYYRVQAVVRDPGRGLVRSDLTPFKDGQATADQSAPAAPSDLIVTLNDTNFKRVFLSWTAPTKDSGGGDLTGLTSFQIFRSRQTNSSFVLLSTVSSTQVSYQDTTVEYLTPYFYAVSAVDGSGNIGPRSNAASITTKGLVAPRNVVATGGSGRITIAWSANTETELTGYRVLRYTNPSQTTPEATFTSLQTTYVDSPFVGGVVKVYRIQALGAGGLQSDLSAFSSAQASSPLATPRNVVATGGIGRVTISWAANSETQLTGYRVLRFTSSTQTTAEATFTTVQTTFIDSPLVAGRTLVYRVQALGTGNLQSDLSLFASATTLEDDSAPATPTAFAAVLRSATTIELRWNSPRTDNDGGSLTGLSKFVIYRAVGSVSAGFTNIATVDSTLRVYENSGLVFNTVYIYQIAAIDAKGNESPRSSSVTLTTSTQGASIAAPTNVTATYVGNATPPQVQLSWTPPAQFDSFLIQRATLAAGGSSKNLTFTTLQLAQAGTTYTDTAIQSGTVYVYRISTNSLGLISDPSSTVTVIIP